MVLCLEAGQRPGSRVTKQWWEPDGLDVEGMWTAVWEAEQTDGEDETYGMDIETY